MNLKALPGVFQMLPWVLAPALPTHRGSLPASARSPRFPLWPPGAPGLWFPRALWEGPERRDRGDGWVPLRTAALLGVWDILPGY